MGKQWLTIFLGSQITADGDCSHEIKMLAPWKKSYDQSRQRIKKQRHYFANKDHLVKAMGFFSVVMYGCERQRNGNPGQYSCLENPMGSQRVRYD